MFIKVFVNTFVSVYKKVTQYVREVKLYWNTWLSIYKRESLIIKYCFHFPVRLQFKYFLISLIIEINIKLIKKTSHVCSEPVIRIFVRIILLAWYKKTFLLFLLQTRLDSNCDHFEIFYFVITTRNQVKREFFF